MAALTGTQISVTYVGLLKTSASTVLSSTAQQITDGSGNNSILYLSTAEVGIGGSPTAGKELDVTGNVLITGDLQVDNININGNTISATSGVVTLQDGTIATTQSQGDNSTKVATTAYVDTAGGAFLPLAGGTMSGSIAMGSNNISGGGTFTATTFSGQLDGTISSTTTATTQSQNDNSTKVATTAYVDAAIGANDTLAEILANGNTTGGTDIAVSSGDDITFADSSKSIYGAGSDLQIYHDGSNSLILNDTGKLIIRNRADDQDIQFDCDDGSGGVVSYFYLDGSAVNTRFTKDIKLNDSTKAIFGGGGDLEIYHDGNNSKIQEGGTGSLVLDTNGPSILLTKSDTEHLAKFLTDGAVELYYDNSKKFETTSSGIKIDSEGYQINIEDSSSGNISEILTSNTAMGFFADRADAVANTSMLFSLDNTTQLLIGSSTATFTNNIEVNGTLIDLDSSANATVAIDRGATSNDAIVSWRNAGSEYFKAGLDSTNNDLWSLLHTCGSGLYFDGVNMRFGIGTDSPSSLLTLNAASGGALQWQYNGGNYLRIEADSGGGSYYAAAGLYHRFFTSGTERMRINSSGNVGIAETNPTSFSSGATTLHIKGTVTSKAGAIRLRSSDNSIDAFVYPDSTNGMSTGTLSNHSYRILTNSAERMRIDSNGGIYNSESLNNGNTFYGFSAGSVSTTGQFNTSIGYNSGDNISSGQLNTNVGYNTGQNISTGYDNSVFGATAGQALTTGFRNVFLGVGAGYGRTTGQSNVAIGYYAGQAATTTAQQTFVGHAAGFYNTGQDAVAIGYEALVGANPSTGIANTAVGAYSLRLLSTGQDNVAVGQTAGYSLTTGYNNTLVGKGSGDALTTGQSNTAVGQNSLSAATTTVSNTAIGRASQQLGTGSFNTSVGNDSLENVTGSSNTAVGVSAGILVTSGQNNVLLGYQAGDTITTGNHNAIVGTQAAGASVNATGMALLGHQAGYDHEADYLVAVGYQAAYNTGTGAYATAVGYRALHTLTSGSGNTAVGYASSLNVSTGSNNTSTGYYALAALTTGTYNTAIGVESGKTMTTTSYSTCIGGLAGRDATGGNNTFVGALAGRNATTGVANTVVGAQAVDNNTFSASNNTVVGFTAGQDLTSGGNNTYIGSEAGKEATSSEGQVAVGFEALKDCTTGSGNIAIGKKAGENLTTGGSGIYIGYAAAAGATVTGNNNMAIGDAAGYDLTSGANNILIGKNAGRNASITDSLGIVTTGSNEIQMGNKSHTAAYINIGWTTVSDARDKTKIKDLDKGLDFVENLKPVSYERTKNRQTEETDNKERYGFLAQDVLELEGDKPVIVNNEDKDNLKLTSDYIIPILVNAIKELKQEIEILKSK